MRSRSIRRGVIATCVLTATLLATSAGLLSLPGSGVGGGPQRADAYVDFPLTPPNPRPDTSTPPALNRGPFLPLRVVPEQGDGLGAGRGHEGVDLFAPIGSPVVAVDNAVVLETGSDSGRGNYVSIYSPTADQTYNYFHLLEPSPVKRYDLVFAGTEIGRLGCTGSCFGPHLHFEVRDGVGPYRTPLDPVAYLDGLKVDPRPAPIPPA